MPRGVNLRRKIAGVKEVGLSVTRGQGIFCLPMSSHATSPESARRRSERLLLQIPVLVYGKNAQEEPFRERTHTLVINAHGALLTMSTPVALRQVVGLENVCTGAERDSAVVFIGPRKDGYAHVGVEFLVPDATFWNIEFPPVSWNPETAP